MKAVNQPIIAIPDIHGQLKHFEVMVNFLRKGGYLQDHKLVCLGDYVDRGPDVNGLLDLCVELRRDGHVFLMGNHEYVLLRALESVQKKDKFWINRWWRKYESRTLLSYGILPDPHSKPEHLLEMLDSEMPRSHHSLLSALQPFYEDEETLLVHAGVLFDEPWARQKKALLKEGMKSKWGPDQIFSRQLAQSYQNPTSKTLVTGHVSRLRPFATNRRVMLDCGVDLGGPLVAWISSERNYVFVG